MHFRFLYGQLPSMVMQKQQQRQKEKLASPSPTVTNKRIQFKSNLLPQGFRILRQGSPVYVSHQAITSPPGFGKRQRDRGRGGNAHVLKPGGQPDPGARSRRRDRDRRDLVRSGRSDYPGRQVHLLERLGLEIRRVVPDAADASPRAGAPSARQPPPEVERHRCLLPACVALLLWFLRFLLRDFVFALGLLLHRSNRRFDCHLINIVILLVLGELIVIDGAFLRSKSLVAAASSSLEGRGEENSTSCCGSFTWGAANFTGTLRQDGCNVTLSSAACSPVGTDSSSFGVSGSQFLKLNDLSVTASWHAPETILFDELLLPKLSDLKILWASFSPRLMDPAAANQFYKSTEKDKPMEELPQ
ncbi:hypothetical protein BHM03_00012665 [Ensete ventricosum]|nr:hypothetical protein BHM03_00012665 [Ensete ventricosum]